jgi:hypothetical protein
MATCCPAGHGCNAPDRGESCALELFGAAAPRDVEAAQALERWRALLEAVDRGCGERERRFRRRAFERARDRALIGLAMSTEQVPAVRKDSRRTRRRTRVPHPASRPS